MASKPVLWRNSSPNSRMPTTQRYSGWPHSQKIRIFSQNPRRNSPSNGASAQLRGRKKPENASLLRIDLLQMNRTTVTGFIRGTPKKAVISNSHIAVFNPGTLWYGHTDEVSCTNCAIDAFGGTAPCTTSTAL